MAPVYGYRTWLVDTQRDKKLPKSIASTYIWQPGINVATCKSKPPCEYPPDNCADNNGCGFHAFHRLEDIRVGSMAGIVVGGGEVIVHCNAWRAREVMVVAMIDTGWEQITKSVVYTHATCKELADYFGVRIVPWEAAETVAAEYGEPVPPELIPPEERAHNEERG